VRRVSRSPRAGYSVDLVAGRQPVGVLLLIRVYLGLSTFLALAACWYFMRYSRLLCLCVTGSLLLRFTALGYKLEPVRVASLARSHARTPRECSCGALCEGGRVGGLSRRLLLVGLGGIVRRQVVYDWRLHPGCCIFGYVVADFVCSRFRTGMAGERVSGREGHLHRHPISGTWNTRHWALLGLA